MATKVLVFESDAAFAVELRNEFGKLGCSTTVVEDGNAGLQQAAAEKPDLILLSIELPRMNGFSVCNKLKKDPNLTAEALIAFCRKELTAYKVPRHVYFRGELPKTNVGKILRRALRDELRNPAPTPK